MGMVEKLKQKVKQQGEAVVLFTVFILIQLVIYSSVWDKPLVWDSAIYVAMGKHLFSIGNIGLWEVFRPPFIPIIIGVIWKSGLPLVPFSRLFHMLLTVAGSALIHHQIKQIFDYRKALYSSAVLLASPVFISNTTELLTGVPSALLITVSLNKYLQGQKLISGSLSGLAFLTRFPTILIAPAIAIYEAYNNRNDWKLIIQKLIVYGSPVATLLCAYFTLNYVYLGNPLEPIISGISVPPSDATSVFGTYYLIRLASNPLILLAIPGVYWIIRKREEEFYPYVSALSVFFVFFEAYHHKEVRYGLAFLPFLAVTASHAMKEIEKQFNLKKEVFVSISIVVMLLSAVPIYTAASYQNENAKDYYKAFESLNGTVATNNPGPIQYSDFDYQPLPQGYLEGIFNEGGIDYYGINSCAWHDTTGGLGIEIEQFKQNISDYETIYKDSTSKCNYTIYRVDQR
jgi:4-amino-4-deoxy-L-arabinose transferase-like glycosyltransferase